jgi:hypothetical protein
MTDEEIKKIEADNAYYNGFEIEEEEDDSNTIVDWLAELFSAPTEEEEI